jgi:hypothetical protein
MNTRPVRILMTVTALLTLVPFSAQANLKSNLETSTPLSLVQVIVGAAMTLTGSSIVLAGNTLGGGVLKALLTDPLGSKLLSAGLAILEGKTGNISFAPIESWEEANALGLSEQEVRAYNAEISNIRWLQNKIALESESPKWDERIAVDKAREQWLHAVDQRMISSDAFSAVQKIAFSLYLKSRPIA